MPKALLEALHNHPKLSNRVALFACWGLKEERQYLEDLGTTLNFSELVIDFRPRGYVAAERLAELVHYQKHLILGQTTLKSLTIKNRYPNARPLIEPIQVEQDERLPSVQRLSLEHYQFTRDIRGLQFHIDVQSLRSLVLVACANWHLLLEIPHFKLSQLIIRRARRRTVSGLAVSEKIILQSFLCGGHGFEELELESLGIFNTTIDDTVKSNSGSTIRKLRLHNLEHYVFTRGTNQPVPRLRSTPFPTILNICRYCTHLQSLELDLTETDIISVSEDFPQTRII